jgi:hypothetical protein
MTANELRIGNWYLMSGMGNNQFEQFINWTQALDFEAYGQPIVLTSDILEKCGFENILNGEYYYHKVLGEKITLYLPYFNLNYYIGSVQIKHLHQLQNLYYCLVGEELSINL